MKGIIWKYLYTIALIAPLLAVVVVNNQWAYGAIYYRYGWFYLTVFVILLFTVLDFLFRKGEVKLFRVSVLDIILFFFISYLAVNYYLSTSISETYLCLSILLYVYYICFRYAFAVKRLSARPVLFTLLGVGGIEAVWGILQIYRLLPSYHANFLITGSFLNPGPFGGFLAICVPLAVYAFLNEEKQRIKGLLVFLLLLFVAALPASMSRTAWIASFCGTLYVVVSHYGWLEKMKQMKNWQKIVWVILCFITFAIVIYFLFILKSNSVFGRFQVWFVSLQVLAEHFFTGVGLGNFSAAYGLKQIACFTTPGIFPLDEKLVDCPEYAFNEFIHIGVELGIGGILFLIAIFYMALRNSRYTHKGVTGSLIVLFIFSLFSYPLRLLPFLIVFAFLLSVQSEKAGITLGCPNLWVAKTTMLLLFCLSILLFGNRLAHYEALKVWNKAVYTNEFKQGYRYLRDQRLYLTNYIDALIVEKRYFEANCAIHQLQSYCCDLRPYILAGMNYQSLGDFKRAENCFLNGHYLVPERLLPCYFLARLYLQYEQKDQALQWAEHIVNKEVRIQSELAFNIQQEMEKLIKEHKSL